MSESEFKAHKSEVDAARLEFFQHWDLKFVQGLTKPQAVRVEQMAWLFFLHGKGLKK